ncbi:MAG: endolytic transglycosylase MltG [Cyclobacteriaceae bacterium]|nr:endolytic transglycosylase MltG [Cyclobacteriaceae bacterium]
MQEVSKTKLAIYLIASTLLITFVFYGYQICYTPNILVDKDDRQVIITSGTTFRKLQEDLGKGGFVNDMVSFSFLARLKGYDRKISPGRFVLRRNMTNLQALEVLTTARQEPVRVTFTNARIYTELSEKITRNVGVHPEEFDESLDRFIANNPEGFTRETIMAMFIPNTYEVYFNIVPDELVARLYEEYKKFWNESRLAKAKALGLTPIEVSTLASIVQAENHREDEAPRIAGLYINRLKKNMPLQADPTLVFAVGDFSIKRVLDKHKEVDSPYNTYKNAGLPPGPINMPGIPMIDAVLNYEQHDYIYMCSKEDFSGYHNFAKTLSEHNRNAAAYQRALTIEQRKARQAK